MDLYPFIRPLLFSLSPETAHHVTLSTLSTLDKCLKIVKKTSIEANPIEFMGLQFPNRLGLAAGLDKSGAYINALSRLGFGFIEIGTITPRAQPGNEKPRLFRLKQSRALINRMGFNNPGIAQCLTNIKKSGYQGILGINIGKNKDTPLAQANEDYITGLVAFYPYASYITVNISSPNTPGLRELQQGDALKSLLENLKNEQAHCQQQYKRYVPLLVKVAPDLSEQEIADIASTLIANDIDGLIATNTTSQRPSNIVDKAINEPGGLSGQPLHSKSIEVIKQFHQHLGDKLPIIGVGGIQSAEDYQLTRAAGASLCQIYTGLIYQGPQLIKQCLLSER